MNLTKCTMSQQEWNRFVDEILAEEQDHGCGNDRETLILQKRLLGEYEIGVDPDDFYIFLRVLKPGQVVEFNFKRFTAWYKKFVKFVVETDRPYFEYLGDAPLYYIKNLAGAGIRSVLPGKMRCKVINSPLKEDLADRIAKRLSICLSGVSNK